MTFKKGDIIVRTGLGKRGRLTERYEKSGHLWWVAFDGEPSQLVVHEESMKHASAIDRLGDLAQLEIKRPGARGVHGRSSPGRNIPDLFPKPARGAHFQARKAALTAPKPRDRCG